MAERGHLQVPLEGGETRSFHRGITNDLDRRQAEHQEQSPGAKIEQIGRRTTRDAALRWEREGGKRPRR